MVRLAPVVLLLLVVGIEDAWEMTAVAQIVLGTLGAEAASMAAVAANIEIGTAVETISVVIVANERHLLGRWAKTG
jgi:hypothetical protein